MEQLCLMPFADEVDRLFQLPLAEFTAARDELLKRAPASEKLHVRALRKPNVPAWVVNQVYWRDRRAYDALVRAAERLRAAHAQAIKGRKVDLAGVELSHAAAIKRAADRARAILAGAGDPATPATMNAVMDTLQALPGGAEPGRLTRPLAPLSFAALGAIVKEAKTPKGLAEIVTFAPPKPAKPTPEEAEEHMRRARELEARRRREIDARIARAERAIVAAKASLQRAEAAKARADRLAEAAAMDAGRRRTDLDRLEREVRGLRDERARLSAR